eukprot:g2736.t1
MSSLAKRVPLDGRAGQARWAEDGQARRIRNALARQRARRRNLTAHARELAAGRWASIRVPGAAAVPPLPATGNADEGDRVSSTMEMEVDTANPVESKKLTRRRRGKKRAVHSIAERQFYSDQLAHHEWMVHIPQNLRGRKESKKVNGGGISASSALPAPVAASATSEQSPNMVERGGSEDGDENGWFVSPRPEGRRCLVIAAGGKTVVRDKNGCVVASFNSILPNGARHSRHNNTHSFGDGGTILDCILQEKEVLEKEEDGDMLGGTRNGGQISKTVRTYWILDVMCWKGYSLYDCDASFRAYWLDTKISELEQDSRGRNHPRFLAVPRFDCDADGIAFAYDAQNFEFQMDGLLFVNRAGHYAPGPDPTPLTLIWKDAVCAAPYFMENYKNMSTASSNNMTEKALCGLLEGLNVQSSEPIFLRASQNRSDGECNHETPTLSVQAAKGGTFDDGSGGGSASPVDLVTQGGIILGSVQNNSYPHGRILKFAIDSVTFDSQTGKPSLINPRFLGRSVD